MKLMQSVAVALVFSSALVACDRRDEHLQDEARSADTTVIDENTPDTYVDPDVASQAVDPDQRCTGLTGQALTDCEAEAAAATGADISSGDNVEPPVGD
ncbi:hypothetical protein [Novilysobacter spongiicola]|uniref:Uncharacterized protein n=1 Tax=Lysobacter spongiicola DSM 21749 TaxID=1122188 RepID=A0A1T4R621_9GAMM|nr:hypothetical protein [Lysobacter spongiicola]SKA11492.1 hypothetical protein SAMN02745674_01990 [Lysobacter spongiicola DSM 21749]